MSLAPHPEADAAPSPTATAAFALINADGVVVRCTEPFEQLLGVDSLADDDVRAALAPVVAGSAKRASFELRGHLLQCHGAAEGLLGLGGERVVLVSAAVPGAGGDADSTTRMLVPFMDNSPAMVWVIDLEGRFLYVNRRYGEQLGVDSGELLGRKFAELEPKAAIDAPRRLQEPEGRPEPLQLEYTIPAFAGRPPFAALRFPLRRLDGEPLAVCGIATLVGEARVGHLECTRLLAIERWARGGPDRLRTEILDEWELHPPGGVARPAAAQPAVADDGATERLLEQVRAAQERAEQLETSLAAAHARASSAEGSLAAAAARTAELESALAGAESQAETETDVRAAALEGQLRAALTQQEQLLASLAEARAATETANAELDATRSKYAATARDIEAAQLSITALEAKLEVARRATADAAAAGAEHESGVAALTAQLEHAQSEREKLAAQHQQVRTELEKLAAQIQQLEAERETLAAQLQQAQAEGEAMRGELELARADSDQQLAEARGTVDQRNERVAALEAELDDVRRAAADAAAAGAAAESGEAGLAAELESTQAESRRLAAELVSREAALTVAQADAANAGAERESARTELETTRGELEQMQADGKALGAELDAARRELDAMLTDLLDATTARDGLQAELDRSRESAEAALAQVRANLQTGVEAGRAEIDAALAIQAATQRDAEAARDSVRTLGAELTEARESSKALEVELSEARESTTAVEAELAEARESIRALEERAAAGDDRRAAAAEPPPATAVAVPVAPAEPAAGRGSSTVWTAAAQLELTRALAQASAWRTALSDAVRIVGSRGGWDVAIAWSKDDRGGRYGCTAMWCREGDELAKFETAVWQHPQPAQSEVSLADRAGSISWFADLRRTRDQHLTAAVSVGMRSAVLVPMRHGAASAGVLEFCSRDKVEDLEEIRSAVASVATQLAHLSHLLRSGESPRWRTGRM